jgi:hypothetical protein
MTVNLEELPIEVREEIERLRGVNTSMGAYLKLVEGALLAAWQAGEPERERLAKRPDDDLTEDEKRLRAAWELVGEVVLRLPQGT